MPLTDTPSFAAWLSKRRKQLGYTQQSLADRVNRSSETIRRIEAGTRKPSEQLATLLAEALRVPPEERETLIRWARSQPDEQLLEPANRPRHNLPHDITSFVGRGKQIASTSSLLGSQETALLTLTGPGGSEKTRLALRVAADQPANFPDGVYFVNLAPITDPGLVLSTIAQVLGVQEIAGQPINRSLKNYLSEKQLLLLLDNFEQVVDAAPLVADLLAGAPRLKVLVTSREALRLRGEQNYPVPPLSLPDATSPLGPARVSEYEAIQLFTQRAVERKLDFCLTDDNCQAVVEIAARLDGLPLAIELAAARIPILPPQAMLAKMQEQTRLGLFTSGARDLPARQQTLRNMIQWSYDLLDPEEQTLFRRLAVFQGGRTLRMVETVCNIDGDLGSDIDVLDRVQSLVSKNLLEQRESENGEPRFRMLETIREFAGEKLRGSGDTELLRLSRQHAAYFLALAEEIEPGLSGPGLEQA